jgi:hypothetical protein
MQIIFNGKSYNSLEEMPANERQAFEHMQQIFVDANGNGIPDFMEGDMFRKVMSLASGNASYGGQVINNLDELPPDVREKVQRAMEKLKQSGLFADVPNIQGTAANTSTAFEPAFQPSQPLISQEPVVQVGGSKTWMLILAFVAAIVVCVGAAAVIMFMR